MTTTVEPRRCVAPVAPDNDDPSDGIVWVDDGSICGKDATTERTVEGMVCALCAACAAEFDRSVKETG